MRLIAEDDDTLLELAERHGLDARLLLQWNATVHPGITLRARLLAGTHLLTEIEVEQC